MIAATSPQERWLLGVGILGLLFDSSCTPTSFPTGTRIKPSHFRFATIVKPDKNSRPSGWRAVCIDAAMAQSAAAGPTTSAIRCRAEFGTPIINFKGPVPLTRAQRVSANVANDVAYLLLTTTSPVTGQVCEDFKRDANVLMDLRIRGAKVTSCSEGTPIVRFP